MQDFINTAKMNFSTGKFDWGGEIGLMLSSFLNLVCLNTMVLLIITLMKNDETKKVDGTASDVGNSSYGGNAMMEWGQLWWKLDPMPEWKWNKFLYC